MANAEHLAILCRGVEPWNQWRDRITDLNLDLRNASLSNFNLRKANLKAVDLSASDLSGAQLTGADLTDAVLKQTIFTGANLSNAKLNGADLKNATLTQASLDRASLARANLRGAHLRSAHFTDGVCSGADFTGAQLTSAILSRTDFSFANLSGATFSDADLQDANLESSVLRKSKLLGAKLQRAAASHADFGGAHLQNADLNDAVLAEASFRNAQLHKVNLHHADLHDADLSGADLRSATVQWTRLDGANITGTVLWETQRANWSIRGILCEHVFWDAEAQSPTKYGPGEFERLYSEQCVIELVYPSGVSTFELSTLPALLHHLTSIRSGTDIRLKSIVETGGGAKVSISVGGMDRETTELMRVEANRVLEAQLALRDNRIREVEIQNAALDQINDKLIQALLQRGTQQNIFNAPVFAPALPSGKASVTIHQSFSNNAQLLTILGNMAANLTQLNLAHIQSSVFEAELRAAEAELEKQSPSKSVLSTTLGCIRTLAFEAVKGAAGKLGEEAAANWHLWLDQLSHFISNLN